MIKADAIQIENIISIKIRKFTMIWEICFKGKDYRVELGETNYDMKEI